MSEKQYMTMARASEKELDDLQEFFDLLQDAKDGEIDAQTFLVEHYELTAGATRIIFGYRVLFAHVCDPTLDYLEFKPEIKSAMENTEKLSEAEKRVKELESILNAGERLAWIPIEDGLPEADGWYLITALDQSLKTNLSYVAFYADNQFWFPANDGKMWSVTVLAYRPLPEAYEVRK